MPAAIGTTDVLEQGAMCPACDVVGLTIPPRFWLLPAWSAATSALMLVGVCVVGTFGVTMVLSQLYLPRHLGIASGRFRVRLASVLTACAYEMT